MSSNPHDKIEKHLVEGSAAGVLATRAAYNFGARGAGPLFYRFVVLEVIFDPTIVDEKKRDHFANDLGVANIQLAMVLPRNTIVAKRVQEGKSHASAPALFLFPFFPPAISLPVQAGEHVWAMFEDPKGKKNDLGYWFCRIVEPGFVEDVNHTHAGRTFEPSFNPGTKDTADGKDAVYEFRNGRPAERDGERYSIAESLTLDGDADAYEKLMTETDAGKLMAYEPVPRYRKRPGELVFEGTNNALIVVGRDRTGAAAVYTSGNPYGGEAETQVVDKIPDDDTPLNTKGAGSIDLVVGRGQTDKTKGKKVKSKTVGSSPSDFQEELDKAKKNLAENEGDPDLKHDRSRVLISQKTKPDKNFKIDKIVAAHNKLKPVKDEDKGGGAIVVKSDKVRLIARQDLVIIVQGETEKDEDGNVKEADDAASPDKCATITLKTNGDIVFTPAATGLIRLGGEDATLSPLCTRVSRAPGMPGPLAPPPPIVDTMGGAQGAADGLNGTFATKVLLK